MCLESWFFVVTEMRAWAYLKCLSRLCLILLGVMPVDMDSTYFPL